MKGETLRVAIIVANVAPRYGGPARAALSYASALAQAGVDVRVITTDQDGPDRLRVKLHTPQPTPDGYTITYYPGGPSLGSRPASISLAIGIIRAFAWADIAHVSSLYLPHNVFSAIASLLTRTPYVIRPHGTLEHYQRQFSVRAKWIYDILFGRRYIRKAAGLHFTSASEAEAAGDVIGAVPRIIVPIPLRIPRAVAHPEDSLTVLFLGRVTAKKQVALLIDAWPTVLDEFPNARLVIAGPIDADQLYLKEIGGDKVYFAGIVDGENKQELFEHSAVFVLPSRNENFGVAVAEAMSYGLPVIVSSDVALAEVVRKSGAGEALACTNASTLAASIQTWLRDAPARRNAGRNARATSEALYGLAPTGAVLRTALIDLRGSRNSLQSQSARAS